MDIPDESEIAHGAIARDKDGEACRPEDPTACQWCAQGWGLRYDPFLDSGFMDRFRDELLGVIGLKLIRAWNDSRPRTKAGRKEIASAVREAFRRMGYTVERSRS